MRIGIIAIFANDRARNAPLWSREPSAEVPFNLSHMCQGLVTCDLTQFNILLAFQNKTSMKKKEYERPTTQVVQLKQQAYLLQASATGDVNATMDGTWTEEDI